MVVTTKILVIIISKVLTSMVLEDQCKLSISEYSVHLSKMKLHLAFSLELHEEQHPKDVFMIF